jgi:hypothetical protein
MCMSFMSSSLKSRPTFSLFAQTDLAEGGGGKLRDLKIYCGARKAAVRVHCNDHRQQGLTNSRFAIFVNSQSAHHLVTTRALLPLSMPIFFFANYRTTSVTPITTFVETAPPSSSAGRNCHCCRAVSADLVEASSMGRIA